MRIHLDLTSQEWIDLTTVLTSVKERLSDKPMDLDRYCDEVGEKLAKLNVINKVLTAMQKPTLLKK